MNRSLADLLLLLTAATNAAAQVASEAGDWPRRVIRFIVSAAPGSAGDTVCRIVAQKLSERLGQQFILDNRPAAGGTVASEALAHAAPDGYTIGLVTTSTHAIATIFSANLPYDPAKDFAPISVIGSSPYVLAVYPGLPATTVAELVALAKAKPKHLNNAAFGSTSLGYLAGVLFAQYTGVALNEVSYRSSAQAVIDTVAGRIEMQFSTLAPAIPLIRDGKLRALATTGAKRVSTLPEIPMLAEAGLPGYDVALWMGIAAPAGTPPGIVDRLNREISAILASPEVKASLLHNGMVAEPGLPRDLAARIRDDVKKWRDVASRAGIKPE
jgi:tripartite-type tricarboxylate transporter receptor subunit TctC